MPESRNTSHVVLITGASSGIGLATAHRLLEEGWRVYASARRVERLSELTAKGAQSLALDVTDEASMAGAVQSILDAEGAIDVLVNNAGYGEYGAVEDVPLDEARHQFEVNVYGLVRLTQLVVPGMRSQGRGRIVNVSSMGGKMSFPMGGWYHATKHAVEALSDALRLELASFGIQVIVIEPGIIRTEWADIACEKLMHTSAAGAYSAYAKATAEGLHTMYARQAAGPEVIASVISRALKAKRPCPRYRTPLHAKAFVLLRKCLPDRAFDALVRSQMKLPK